MFCNAPEQILEILEHTNVTYNYHRFCVTEQTWKDHKLNDIWRILATNKDIDGKEFISVFESEKNPFYGLEFHPEKNLYEFKPGMNIPHSQEASLVSQYFANFFVNEARKNDHAFESLQTLRQSLIYNYSPYYTGKENSAYEQLYMFKETDFVDVL